LKSYDTKFTQVIKFSRQPDTFRNSVIQTKGAILFLQKYKMIMNGNNKLLQFMWYWFQSSVAVVLSKQISFFYLYNKKLFMLLNVSLCL